MEEVLGTCIDRGIKVVANAGGLNPAGLARAPARRWPTELGLARQVAHVEGDDLLDRLGDLQAAGDPLAHLDTGRPLAEAGSEPVTANAYLGGFGHRRGPGRRRRRGRDRAGHRRLARGRARPRGTSAGAAPTGTAWPGRWWPATSSSAAPRPPAATTPSSREVPGLEHPGFPIAEVADDGSAVITKHPGTGGLVSVGTVTAQLLYEIGGPHYANPDVVADFDTIDVERRRATTGSGCRGCGADRRRRSSRCRSTSSAAGATP